MPTLQFNISEAEIEKLNYERYAYPDPMVQKRIFAVYLKATLGWNNSIIGEIAGLHYNIVGNWIKAYKTKGFGTGAVFDLGAPYIFKHFDVIANGSPGKPGAQNSNLNLPQIRFAEVLLIYAEAQNEVGGPVQPAYDALKRIRDRAQLVTPVLGTYTQGTFREAVWRERWHEMCYENITWFDMVRLKKVYNEDTNGFDDFVGHINLSSNQPLQAKHLLFPIPTREMQNNPNLKPQNPGYN